MTSNNVSFGPGPRAQSPLRSFDARASLSPLRSSWGLPVDHAAARLPPPVVNYSSSNANAQAQPHLISRHPLPPDLDPMKRFGRVPWDSPGPEPTLTEARNNLNLNGGSPGPGTAEAGGLPVNGSQMQLERVQLENQILRLCAGQTQNAARQAAGQR